VLLLDGCGHDALFITGAAVVPFCLNLPPLVWRVKPCLKMLSGCGEKLVVVVQTVVHALFYSFTRHAFAPTQGHMRHFYALLFLWFECFRCLYLGTEEVHRMVGERCEGM
jgi:hypothetical protein